MEPNDPPEVPKKNVSGVHPAMGLSTGLMIAARRVITRQAIRRKWLPDEWRWALEVTGLCDSELPAPELRALISLEAPMLIQEYLSQKSFETLSLEYQEAEGKYKATVRSQGDFYAGFGDSPMDALIAVIKRHTDTTPQNGKLKVTSTHEIADGETPSPDG